MFPLHDVASGPREFTMSILCSLHSGVRTAMIYMHRFNPAGKGVLGPADSPIQGLALRSSHGPADPSRPCEYRWTVFEPIGKSQRNLRTGFA